VWTHLSRYEDRPEYVPRLKKLEILDKKPGLIRVKQTVDASIMTAKFTAFFKLGETPDRDGRPRPIYLWTTSTAPPEEFQFDAFRVFIWNAARDRYDAAQNERGLRGRHPVLVEPGGKVQLIYAKGPEGPVERHIFEWKGRKLRQVSHEPWNPPEPKPAFATPLEDGREVAPSNVWTRASEWLHSWRK